MAIDTLLPKKLEKSDASYKSVIELNETLLLPVLLDPARVLYL